MTLSELQSASLSIRVQGEKRYRRSVILRFMFPHYAGTGARLRRALHFAARVSHRAEIVEMVTTSDASVYACHGRHFRSVCPVVGGVR